MEKTVTSGYEMSATQKRAWLQIKTRNQVFNNQISLLFRGAVNKNLLKGSLIKITAGFQILRTKFVETDKNLKYPIQVVQDQSSAVSWEDINLSEFSNQQQDGQLYKIASNAFSSALFGVDVKFIALNADDHVLVFTLPVLLGDLQSAAQIVEQLVDVYLNDGHLNQQHEEPIQFVQFASWHNQTLEDNDSYAEQLWQSRTQFLLEKSTLSVEQKQKISSHLPKIAQVDLEGKWLKKINEFCAENNLDKQHFTLSIWSILIWQYFDQQNEFTIGRVSSGRSLENFGKIIGPFAKTLPFNVTIDNNQHFNQIYSNICREALLTEDWQDNFHSVDLEFPYSFEFVRIDCKFQENNDLKVEVNTSYTYHDFSKLKLLCFERNDNLKFEIYYDESCFTRLAIDCIIAQFKTLIKNMISRKNVPLSENIAISSFEENLIKTEFNNTDFNFENPSSLLEAISQHSVLNPHKVAVKDSRGTLSYVQLWEESTKLARSLAENYSIKRGDIVAIKQERSIFLIVSLIGVLKVGAIYLPLDPNIPPGRLAYVLKDSKAKILLTDEELEFEGDVIANLINIQEIKTEIANTSSFLPKIQRDGEDVFYVMYTSGSTGKPKGVLVKDKSIYNYTRWLIDTNNINATDSTILFTTIAFDLNYTALWSCLVSGCTLHLSVDSSVFDPDILLTQLVAEKITYIKLTPSHFSLLVNSNKFELLASQLNLRLIILGGEPVSTADIRTFFTFQKDVVFMNHFGPTETTVGIVAKRFDLKSFSIFEQRPTIGKPIYNNKIHLLDNENRIVPVGAIGELAVSGENVSSGYLNKGELTAVKFINNPNNKDEVIYKTGDLGRWLPNGDIEFIGRKDLQVKIRGFRVEPEEIENTLKSIENIQFAFVTIRKDNQGEAQLVAFYSSNKSKSPGAIKKYLENELPTYMVPVHLHEVAELPMLANGKIDRLSLLNNLSMQPNHNDELIPPQTETEILIAGYWKDILEIQEIGIHDNFFELGGNSFKLVRVFKELSEKFPGKITLTDLFKHNDIHNLARYLEANELDHDVDETTFGFEV